MPVVLDVTADPAVRPRVVASPLVELGAALHVLAEPGHHPERAAWVADVAAAIAESLDEALPADLDTWAFTVRGLRSAVFLRPGPEAVPSWRGELATLRATPPDALAWALLRPLLATLGRPLPAGSPARADRRLREAVLASARARGPEVTAVAEQLLADPAAALRYVDLLERCWRAFFAEQWQRSRPVLAASAARAADTARTAGPLGPFRLLGPAVTVEPTRVTVDKVQSKRIDVGRRGLVLAVSAFAGPHVLVADDPPGPVVVVAGVVAGTDPPAVTRSTDVLRRLEALAHPDRMRICRAVATEARSAPEIASLWRMSPTRVTRHLTALRRAGLVASERRGHFVVYRLSLETVRALGGDLVDALLR